MCPPTSWCVCVCMWQFAAPRAAGCWGGRGPWCHPQQCTAAPSAVCMCFMFLQRHGSGVTRNLDVYGGMQCSMWLDCVQHAGPAGGVVPPGASHVGKFGVIATSNRMLQITPNLFTWRVSHGFACPCLQQAPYHAGVVMHSRICGASAQTGTHLLSAP